MESASGLPEIALAIVGSNTTAIAAESVARTTGYREMKAIVRRRADTSLPVAFDGDAWAARLKRPGFFGAKKTIAAFIDHITSVTGGRVFDCFIHHSKDPFSQLLSGHPLCRKYFYIEEGFTALIGGTFGRPKKRTLRKWIWGLRSRIFHGSLINRYREFFDTSSPKYGGVYALSKGAFKGFPNRHQLDSQDVSLAIPLPAELVIFLDSQYFIGNCGEADYTQALTECLGTLVEGKTSAAIKFHPGEKDEARRNRILGAVRSVPGIENLIELPPSFVGERMAYDPTARVVVGTSAIGLYLGERGFRTFSFAKRIIPRSERFAAVCSQLPAEFLETCAMA